MAIRKLFIANRGEIAVRIIRAAKALGIKTVQAASAADRDMLAVRLADETVEIGPAHAGKSYLEQGCGRGGRRGERRRRHSSGLRLPRRERGFR